MSNVNIQTEHLKLVLQTPEEVLARIEAMSPLERAEVSADWLARIRASTAADPWMHGFAIVDRASGVGIGSCGFKGPCNAEGAVEIAYGVDPEHHGRGYATEAARALVDFAFAHGAIRLVRAHTRTGNLASELVLKKCGFEKVGEVVDPEDGPVWRWARTREST